MNIVSITFSPTGTSRIITNTITQKIGVQAAKHMATSHQLFDITKNTIDKIELESSDLLVVGVPVYGGHVSPTAMKRMEGLHGKDTPSVAVVVYGNRHYENALNELAEFLNQHGFRVIAAGTFIGEHSYSTPEAPIATGRPDITDLTFAKEFGHKIAEKISTHQYPDTVNVTNIEQPHQDIDVMQQFKLTVSGWVKDGVPMPKSPDVNPELCTKCGLCADLCPTSSIPTDNPAETIVNKCIKCCACVKGCPNKARSFPTPFARLLSENFAIRKDNKILL